VLQVVLANNLPFHTIDSPHLKALIDSLRPGMHSQDSHLTAVICNLHTGAKSSSARTMRTRVLDDLYALEMAKFVDVIKGSFQTLSIDGWKHTRQ
jgi:hypothetical protein